MESNKVLAFIRQFKVAFLDGDFTGKSKLRHVSMYLKDTASDWWISLVLEGQKPRTWKDFKKIFLCQFLESDFETDFENEVKMEWDWLAQDENQKVCKYIAKFWKVLMRVTPFMKISENEKKRKFVAGLLPGLRHSLKVYPHATLHRMMESAMVLLSSFILPLHQEEWTIAIEGHNKITLLTSLTSKSAHLSKIIS